MNILVLNGSPHVNGNTMAMVNAFADGAREKIMTFRLFMFTERRYQGVLAVNTVIIRIMEYVYKRMICRIYMML